MFTAQRVPYDFFSLMSDLKRPAWVVASAMAFLFCFSVVTPRADAQSGGELPEVDVTTVSFRNVQPDNGGEGWLEAVVELNVGGTPGAGVYARNVDRVRVTLSISIKTRDNDFDFFRATAEAVSLRAGRASVRFYLPPEIVRREQINGTPHAYLVELAAKGRPLPAGSGNASSVLQSAEVISSFKDRVVRAAPLNDGILVPQYDSPFEHSYGNDTPSFVRRTR
jgi:hypothetical protein